MDSRFLGMHAAIGTARFPVAYSRPTLVLTGVLLLTSVGVRASDTAPAPKAPKPEITANGSSSDLSKLIAQFNKRRDSMLADRQALLDQLKNATAEQRKQILNKMQAQQKDLIEVQRALGKQIRDEMRKLRESTPGSRR